MWQTYDKDVGQADSYFPLTLCCIANMLSLMYSHFYKYLFIGFDEGYIHWDDENSNSNSWNGILPNGTYGSDTEIYYCCR